MSRTDIRLSDVFISWTGDDKELKNKIKYFFNEGQLTCTESEESCQGNFEQWSKEAATSSTIFLLILTENTLNSKYVPVEIQEALTMDDAANRIIIVCSNFSLYNKVLFKFGKVAEDAFSSRKISAIILPENGLTIEVLNEIYNKTTALILNRFDKIYRENTKPDYIKLVSLYKAMQKTTDEEFAYDKLYISRTVTEIDNASNLKCKYVTPKDFLNENDVFFLYGSAGCGKTQYINQIKNDINENTLLISLSCSKVASSNKTLYGDLYEEFTRILGNRNFYTEANFNRLITARHIVLVLDGMDEIATENGMRAFIAKVEEYYKPNDSNITLLFTSRDVKNANYIVLNGQNVRKFYLNDLTNDEIEKLGNNLFLLFGAEDKGKEFYVNIQDLNNEIKSNPLLLSQLAIIYKDFGKVPETIVEIFDAISEMTFSMDLGRTIVDVPIAYQDMILNIRGLLKEFAKVRYSLLSEGENLDPVEIFTDILQDDYSDSGARASFLVNYLQNRSILADGEFYHKLFLEYFTAIYYYERSFRLRKIDNMAVIRELFGHYNNPFWAQVIQLYLIKADSCINDKVTNVLYQGIINVGNIMDYTLLFDTCRDLIYHKEAARVALLTDILYKSAEKIYPPYGPLFWYVPKYELYEETLLSVDNLKGNAKALALVRDVCFIFGHFDSSFQVTSRINGNELFAASKSELKGVRKALCEIFFLGNTTYDGGKDIYPRCFNVEETLKLYNGYFGVIGRMNKPFNDELELYESVSFCKLNNELIGLVSCNYDEQMDAVLKEESNCKLSGLILNSSSNTTIKDISVDNINLKSIKVLYIPENCTSFNDRNLDKSLLNFCKIGIDGIQYQRIIKQNITEFFESCKLGKSGISGNFHNDNEVIIIVGPAGCGKTILLKQLNSFADNKTLNVYFNCRDLLRSELEFDFKILLMQRIGYYYPSVDFYRIDNYSQLILSFDEVDFLIDQPRSYKYLLNLIEQIDLFGLENKLKTTLIFASRYLHISNLIKMSGKKFRVFSMPQIKPEIMEKFLKGKLDKKDLFQKCKISFPIIR